MKQKRTFHTAHGLVLLLLLAVAQTSSWSPSAVAQEIRLKKYTKEYFKVIGYEANPKDSESYENTEDISIDWSATEPGHRTVKLTDGLWGTGNKETTLRLNLSDSQWPVFPSLGTNFSFLGLKHLYTEGQRAVEAPVDNRGSGEFRFTRFTNDFTMSTSYPYTNFSGETPAVQTVSWVHTNYIRSDEKWEAELVIENFTEGTNGFWVEVNFKPNDANDLPVAPGDISLGNDTNGNPVYLDGEWNTLVLAGDYTTNKLKPEFAQAVTTAVGQPSATAIWTKIQMRTEGSYSANSGFATNEDVTPLFGTNTPTLGGPVLHRQSQVVSTNLDSVGHGVEFSAVIPGTTPLSRFEVKQVLRGGHTVTFVLSEAVNGTNSITLEKESGFLPNGERTPDGPDIVSRHVPSRTIFALDGPGPKLDVFGYFGANPTTFQGQPAGVGICQVIVRQEFILFLRLDGQLVADPLVWYCEHTVSGPTIENVTSSAGKIEIQRLP